MDPATQTANPESSAAPAVTETPQASAEAVATQGPVPEQAPGAGTAPVAPEMLTIMGTQIEKSKVPPEFLEKVQGWEKSYTQKTQEYSAARKKAEALDQLSRHPAFQKWYAEQTNPQARKAEPESDPWALTPEKQAELLSDPKAMRTYIEGLTKNVVEQVALPAARQAQYEARTLRNEQEVNRLAAKYSDFDDLNNNGKIEAATAKYAQRGVDLELEDAYWLAKRPFMESEAQVKAQQRVQEKVSASTLPPGGGAPSQVKLIPAKGLSFEDKLRAAFAAKFRGEEIKFDPSH